MINVWKQNDSAFFQMSKIKLVYVDVNVTSEQGNFSLSGSILTVISMFHVAWAAICRNVQEYYTGRRELFETWGKKCVQLAIGGLVQQVLVGVFSSIVSLPILLFHKNTKLCYIGIKWQFNLWKDITISFLQYKFLFSMVKSISVILKTEYSVRFHCF